VTGTEGTGTQTYRDTDRQGHKGTGKGTQTDTDSDTATDMTTLTDNLQKDKNVEGVKF
jgi:hypothetical protein